MWYNQSRGENMGGFSIKYVRGVDTIEEVILKGTKEQNEKALAEIYSIKGVLFYDKPSEKYTPMDLKVGLGKGYLEKLQFVLATLPFEFIYRGKEYKSPDEIDFIDVKKYEEESAHMQGATIEANCGEDNITLYYRRGKEQDGYEDKIFAAVTDNSISFCANAIDSETKKPIKVRITIIKGLIQIRIEEQIKYQKNSFSEYIVDTITNNGYDALFYLGNDKIKNDKSMHYVDKELKEIVSKCFSGTSPVENEEDLKVILGGQYQEFKNLFETSYNENGLFVNPTNEYYKRQKETERIKVERIVLSQRENWEKSISPNMQTLIDLTATEDVIPGLSFSLPQLVMMFCGNDKKYYANNNDPIVSFMVSMLGAFIADPGSIDPQQKDKYVPISVFYNMYPPIIGNNSLFKYADANNLYKEMTRNSSSYKQLGIVVQLYSILQRVLLGEIEPTRESMLEAYLEVDATNTYKRGKKISNMAFGGAEEHTIDEIIDMMVDCSKRLSTAKSAKKRHQILSELQSRVYDPIIAKQEYGNKFWFSQTPRNDTRNSLICEMILEEQLAALEEKKR